MMHLLMCKYHFLWHSTPRLQFINTFLF